MPAGLFSAPNENYTDHINKCKEIFRLIWPSFIDVIRRVFSGALQTTDNPKNYFENMVIFHDIGKLTRRWQKNLNSQMKLPNHASVGAAVFYKSFNFDGISEGLKNALSFAIAIHHTDRGLLSDNIEKPDVQAILDGIVDNDGHLLWAEQLIDLAADYFPEQARNLNVSDLTAMARGLRTWAKGCGLLEQHQRRIQACLAHHILKLCDIAAAVEREEYKKNEKPFGGWLMVDNIKSYVDAITKRAKK
ncbi:MAG: CRISPR-associated endonuclease Cas3'' [Candidatus Aminicenantes bacterium]|nr:CRISPR-associated endonuclease Cas3'' [Candidatus Aminicenantes bacterium]